MSVLLVGWAVSSVQHSNELYLRPERGGMWGLSPAGLLPGSGYRVFLTESWFVWDPGGIPGKEGLAGQGPGSHLQVHWAPGNPFPSLGLCSFLILTVGQFGLNL